MSETRVSYKTVVEKPRTGWAGRLLGWIARHPLWTGLIGGGLAVAIAMARAFEGVRTAPLDAAIISAVVIVVWVVLFYFLRGFFARQTVRRVEVRRDLVADEDRLCWLEDDRELRRIDQPAYTLYSTDVPEEMAEERHRDKPWPVWLVVTGGDEQLVIETKITAGEAANYDEVDDGIVEQADEVLPTALASPLLNLGRD
jgi:hypothetical protein